MSSSSSSSTSSSSSSSYLDHWKMSIVANAAYSFQNICVDHAGNIHIVARDSGYTIDYFKSTNGGASWSTTNNIASTVGNSPLGFVVDSNNYPHVFYQNSSTYDLRHVYWDGDSWESEDVHVSATERYYFVCCRWSCWDDLFYTNSK